jgi:DNA repair exonuclease SbcCD nuclease subunit
LEQRPYVDYPDFRGDSYEAFRQIVDFAVSLRVPLILAGDVLEKSLPDSITLAAAAEGVVKCNSSGVPVYFIEGQHDYSPVVPWLSLFPGARPLYPSGPIRIGNYTVAGLSYTTAAALPDGMKQIHPQTDVLVLHQPWLEFMGQHLPSDGSLVELVPPHVKLVITGDFHVHKRLVIDRPGGPLVVLSPGSSTIQSIKEDPKKYFFIVYDDLSFESVPLTGRPVFNETVMLPSEVDESIGRLIAMTEAWGTSPDSQRLPKQLHQPVWIVRLHASVKAGTKFMDKAKGVAHLFLRTFGQTEVVATNDTWRCSDFAAAVEKSGVSANSPIGRVALALWRSSTPADELNVHVQSWLSGNNPISEVFHVANSAVDNKELVPTPA